jgi:HK97 family phage prohead protease
MEYREFRAEGVASDENGKLTGLVTPFDREAIIGDLKRGGWREQVKPGFFTKTLREADYLLVYQHDLKMPMARKSAGNLTFSEGEHKGQRGLVMDADPVDTSYTRDCMNLVRAKVINGMSFGFNVVRDAWFDDDGNPSDRINGTRRELLEGQLIEGSPVTRPAYGGTAISARDEASTLLEERQAKAADEERGPKPYGDVPYGDPKNGKYPIDIKHVKAAWAYINQRKNAAKYPLNGVTLASVKARIRKAMKKFGFTSGTAGTEAASYEFASAEWRDDDPYLDDWYEIDDEADESADEDETKSRSEKRYPNLGAAILARRDEPAIREMIDYCVSLRDDRDDPDGKEYAAIDTALQMLRKTPPDIKGALATLRERQGQRDDPDGQEYACIDRCIRLLEENPPDVKGAKNTLSSNQMWRRDSDQEPETSTPNPEDDDLALRMDMRRRELELETEAETTSNPANSGGKP